MRNYYRLGADDFESEERPKGNKAWLLLGLLAIGVGIFAFSRKAKAVTRGPLPEAKGEPVADPPPPPAIAGTQYTIQKGDSLSSIAKAQYGDWKWWPLIFDANKSVIGCNWNLIYPGVTIVLPPIDNVDSATVFNRPEIKNWRNPPASC